jgi:hypothetical protein
MIEGDAHLLLAVMWTLFSIEGLAVAANAGLGATGIEIAVIGGLEFALAVYLFWLWLRRA